MSIPDKPFTVPDNVTLYNKLEPSFTSDIEKNREHLLTILGDASGNIPIHHLEKLHIKWLPSALPFILKHQLTPPQFKLIFSRTFSRYWDEFSQEDLKAIVLLGQRTFKDASWLLDSPHALFRSAAKYLPEALTVADAFATTRSPLCLDVPLNHPYSVFKHQIRSSNDFSIHETMKELLDHVSWKTLSTEHQNNLWWKIIYRALNNHFFSTSELESLTLLLAKNKQPLKRDITDIIPLLCKKSHIASDSITQFIELTSNNRWKHRLVNEHITKYLGHKAHMNKHTLAFFTSLKQHGWRPDQTVMELIQPLFATAHDYLNWCKDFTASQ
jgi:hypothetical protein